MENKLIQARVQAFLVQAGSLIVVAIIGVLLSQDFKTLVISHFGDTFVTSAGLLLLNGIASHIRNVFALKKLGAKNNNSVILI